MTRQNNHRDRFKATFSIPEKASFVLNCIMIGLLIIAFRVWHLQFSQYEEKFEESKRPQRKTSLEMTKRASIRDRFNIPLAINKNTFKVGVAYAPMRQIPATAWEKTPEGKRIKTFPRKDYVSSLAKLLSEELTLDAERVEDLIYSKAALFYNIPYTIKEGITEKEYARLKAMQKDWPGLVVQRHFTREYPFGKCACDVIGYLGAISREEHEKLVRELKGLKSYLNEWENGGDDPLPEGYLSATEVMARVQELEELSYTAQDYVGKTGIEALFEEELRGFQGKQTYYADSRGHLLKLLPGAKKPIPGKRVLLSISQELQQYAEALLAQNEEIRTARISGHGVKATNPKQPWIKGGGIVAMDPKTGEILALATYPRFDPNDFIPSTDSSESAEKRSRIHQWFESDAHIADLWNRKRSLERERYDSDKNEFFLQEKPLTWNHYLEAILREDDPMLEWFKKEGKIKNIITILKAVEKNAPLEWFKTSSGKQLGFADTPYRKLLFLDCCQLAVDQNRFSEELLKKVGLKTIEEHHEAEGAFTNLKEMIKSRFREQFHEIVFKPWRRENEKSFLKEKRELEKIAKSYPKPYLDYLDEEEQKQFNSFWDKYQWQLSLALLKGEPADKPEFSKEFIQLNLELKQGAHPAAPWHEDFAKLQKMVLPLSLPLALEYLKSLRSYNDLKRPLFGTYRHLRNRKGPQLEKHLAAAFYPTFGYGYSRSNAFRQAATQGSIFKLITSYEALIQQNEELLNKSKKMVNFNPLDVTDRIFKIGDQVQVGLNSSGKPIPQIYKGGRIPRSSKSNLGKMDLKHAIETSSNLYFSLLAGDILKHPNDLMEAAKKFGYGSKTGIDLPGEISGRLPHDLETNRTGLYATAIGQHSLVVTPLQTAVMLSSLVNGGEILKPQIVHALAGIDKDRLDNRFNAPSPFPHQKALAYLGLDFPLFSRQQEPQLKSVVERQIKIVSNKVPMPNELKQFLCDAMYRVVLKTHTESLWSLSKLYSNHPEAISDYIDLKNQLIGKTSTSEQMERVDLDEKEGTNLYTHVWFGGISFNDEEPNSYEKPELVVVVYLKYGAYGKEAAPVAAQMVRKWREIKASHATSP